jgi:CRP-like cAMP-binding protein
VTTPHDRDESRALSRSLGRALATPLGLAHRPRVTAAAGAVLLKAGDAVHRLPLLEQGRLDAVLHLHGGQGGQVVPVTFGAGEMVFLSHLFTDTPSGVDLVVGEPASWRWVPVPEIEAAVLSDGALVVLLVRFLGQRLREVQMRERGWVERGVHERVCAALVRMSADQPIDPGGWHVVAATHDELAARSGVSRPKASQALKRLEAAGRIRLSRGRIEIMDLAALSAGTP